jgi:hypothetical protein
MDSRLEEAENLTNAMHQLRSQTNWTIISLDLPTSGYADNLDHRLIGPIDQVGCHHTPLVDFMENFIVAFVDELDRELPGVKSKVRAPVGGSLGGNMAMRLGRRNFLPGAHPAPWIKNVVPWSPAAIWTSYASDGDTLGFSKGCDTGADQIKPKAVDQSLKWAGKEGRFNATKDAHGNWTEAPEFRREFFYGGFDWAPTGIIGKIFSPNDARPQAELWWRDDWPCKKSEMIGARVNRHETYDPMFRMWRWRLGAEQLAFSQQQFAPGTKTPLYMYNKTRMFMMCGELDKGSGLCDATRKVVPLMYNTPGYFKYMMHTGHSLDDERPAWVASEIEKFLAQDNGHPSSAPPAVQRHH